MIHELIHLTSRKPVPISRVCLKLAVSEKELRALIVQAKADGYATDMRNGYVWTKVRHEPTGGASQVVGSTRPGRYRVGQATDLHFGSEHCDRDAARQFLQTAWDKKVRFMVCTGDVLDGFKEVLIPEQRAVGFERQAKEAVDVIRKAPPFTWLAIDGNHDGYFSSSIGFVSGRLLQDRMVEAGVDWRFLGVCLGRATIHGARWQMWHPHGGAGTRNAIRRILNERIEASAERVDVVAMGHFHKFATVAAYPERVFGIAGGTFQRKASEFSNRITRPWDIGGAIVSYDLDAQGGVSHTAAEFFAAK